MKREQCRSNKNGYCNYYKCKCSDIKYCQIIKDIKDGAM